MSIQVTSPAFEHGKPIPRKYTGEGDDVSPPIRWSGLPEGTTELALICDDPDAPTADPWVHWVIYKIPADAEGLPEAVPATPRVEDPSGALQGTNSWPKMGYGGPMPPPGHGTHHYHFRLYALDAQLDLEPGLDKESVLQKIEGHVLAQGELIGTYER